MNYGTNSSHTFGKIQYSRKAPRSLSVALTQAASSGNTQNSYAESYGTFCRRCVGVAVVIGGIWFYLHRDRPAPTGLAALSVPAGFKVERVAGPDLVSYPMMATFDDRGRLFICESSGNTLNNAQMAANPD